MEGYDFSGWATKNDLLCMDGRTIRSNAFSSNDGQTVPLVWHHGRNELPNILGHAVLENRDSGVYAYGVFNTTESGKMAKQLVKHGDITSLSIFADSLVQHGGDVLGGNIREVSLVPAGANPGARIDNVTIEHSYGTQEVEDEAIIFSGLTLEHDSDQNDSEPKIKEPVSADSESKPDEVTPEETPVETVTEDNSNKESNMANTTVEHAAPDATIGDIFNTFDEDQKNVVYFMIAKALEDAGAAAHSINDGENTLMHNNIFEGAAVDSASTLSHAAQVAIIAEASKSSGRSLRDTFLEHAGTYGIDNIEILFPDAKSIRNTPDLIKRRTAWVSRVISDTHHVPFSRIKSMTADLTADEARARGYIKGNMKKEEVFALAKRTTTPQTIYKKQKLDRDDIVDISDFDVVVWLKGEMRLMLDEEIARAILIGDGRPVDSEDKIQEDHVRPIWKDNDMYAHHVNVNAGLAAGTAPTPDDTIDAIIRAGSVYEGTGVPLFFAKNSAITDMLLLKDKMGRRLYNTQDELKSVLGVSDIIPVPVMENRIRVDSQNKQWELLGIVVDLADYTVGADRGGEVSLFDDFDIDYNQQKYLIETRISGALTKPKTAMVIERAVTP